MSKLTRPFLDLIYYKEEQEEEQEQVQEQEKTIKNKNRNKIFDQQERVLGVTEL